MKVLPDVLEVQSDAYLPVVLVLLLLVAEVLLLRRRLRIPLPIPLLRHVLRRQRLRIVVSLHRTHAANSATRKSPTPKFDVQQYHTDSRCTRCTAEE